MDPRLSKFRETFTSLNNLLDSFKNSPGSELPKDLKFYRTVFGKVTTPAINNTMVTVHNLQEQLNASFLPKRYAGGNLKIFNNHQLEMIVIKTFICYNLIINICFFYRIIIWIQLHGLQRRLRNPFRMQRLHSRKETNFWNYNKTAVETRM